ncbi:MAG: hypothetical protein M0036_18310 [Desulfobacteraceae bacterium]|nr:hypothetical protein [Desulfobacteraceae bacterium]
MDKIEKRVGHGILGAILGAGTTCTAQAILGQISIPPIIIVAVLCFVAAFFGGIKVIDYLLKLDDYI